ncbi:MAG: DUF4838 domain-containing protein [Clostridia bacterium]|nr:DUF4838 domain-containing protein [Clostridia bacterium]
MKKKWKFLSCMLAATMLSSLVMTACKDEEEKAETEEETVSSATVIDDKEGILEKGKSNYKIVVAKDYSLTIGTAVAEFNDFFSEATKISLEVVTDENITYNDGAKYISLGENKFQESAGVEMDEDITKLDSFLIDTVGSSVFVLGASDDGTLYGTYELLHYLVGFEFYGTDMYALDTNKASVPLMDFDVLEIPDYGSRTPGFRQIREDEMTMNRLRLESPVSMVVGGLSGHTSLEYLPVEKYLNKDDTENYHPEWYSAPINPPQLCYTAHGNEESYEKMLDAAFETLKDAIIRQPNANWANFSMTDSSDWCTCLACNAAQSKYDGSVVAPHIQFLNRLLEITYEWFETEEGKPHARDLRMQFYAYMQLENAPVTWDGDKYVPIDDSVIMHEKLYPTLALTKANYTLSLTEHEKNKDAYENIKKWSVLAKNSGYLTYMYCSNYSYFLVPYDTFGAMQEWYQVLNEYGAVQSYNLGHQGQERGFTTGFNFLKIYLDSKLAWNVDADYGQLIENFFTDVYRDAAPQMKEIFNGFRALSEYNTQTYPDIYLSSSIYPGPYYVEKQIWPKSLLESWRGKIDEALKAIESMKITAPDKYEITYKYISVERIWIDYLLYQLYIQDYNSTEQAALKAELYADIKLADTRLETEQKPIDSLVEELLK